MILRLNFDGACSKAGKLTLISFGVVGYIDGKHEPKLSASEFAGYGTSNMAEWEGLKRCLQLVHKFYRDSEGKQLFETNILGDSQLVVYQFLGKYAAHKPHLQFYVQECKNLFEEIPLPIRKRISVRWVPREKNFEADAAAGKAMKKYIENLQK